MAGLDYTSIELTNTGKITKNNQLKIYNLIFSFHKNHLEVYNKCNSSRIEVYDDSNFYVDNVYVTTKTFSGNSTHGRGMYVYLQYYTEKTASYRYCGMISCYKYLTRTPDILKSAGIVLTPSAHDNLFFSTETILEDFSRRLKRDGSVVIAYVPMQNSVWYAFKKTTNWLNKLPEDIYQYCLCHKAEGIDITYYGPKGGTVKSVIIYPLEGWDENTYAGMTPEIYSGYIDFVKEKMIYVHANNEMKHWVNNLKKNYAFRKKKGA